MQRNQIKPNCACLTWYFYQLKSDDSHIQMLSPFVFLVNLRSILTHFNWCCFHLFTVVEIFTVFSCFFVFYLKAWLCNFILFVYFLSSSFTFVDYNILDIGYIIGLSAVPLFCHVYLGIPLFTLVCHCLAYMSLFIFTFLLS